MVFGVLHVKGKDPIIERVQSSGSHLKWPVSSLSPVGAVKLRSQQEEGYHGAVLVYQDLRGSSNGHTFRIFLTLNYSSWLDVRKKSLDPYYLGFLLL